MCWVRTLHRNIEAAGLAPVHQCPAPLRPYALDGPEQIGKQVESGSDAGLIQLLNRRGADPWDIPWMDAKAFEMQIALVVRSRGRMQVFIEQPPRFQVLVLG